MYKVHWHAGTIRKFVRTGDNPLAKAARELSCRTTAQTKLDS